MNNTARGESGELRRQIEEIVEKRGEDAEEMVRELRALIHDLQARKEQIGRARGGLEKSEKVYRELFDFAPFGYLWLDERGAIVMTNPVACDLLLMTGPELIGQEFSRFIHRADLESYWALARGPAGAKGGRRTGEMRLLAGKAAPFYARVDLLDVTDDRGGSDGFRVAFTDISAQKANEENLKKYTAKLERSNQELQDFAFIASHDLNEPLRKIEAFGDRLQSRCGPGLGQEGLEYVQRMRAAAQRLRDMTRGLLEYSRVCSARGGFVPVALEPLVRGVLSDLEWQIEKNEARVILEELPTLEADPDQLRRLFQNLISNALKFHGNKPVRLRISSPTDGFIENESEYRQIIVEDNGIGFEDAHAERIFRLFERLHGRGAYEGTGMGLAICRRIVERHGGVIVARSFPGKGSTFTVTLPAV